MIEVQNLSKKYGNYLAIDRLNFCVEPGEILGFLGPNGAGKTTTLRIMTTYLRPTSGTILVDNIDVQNNPLQVRKKIGYLPENAPSYSDMTVKEFLKFRMKLKEVPFKSRKNKLEELFHKCWLKKMESKLIGELSKGYRQRVGFAEALCNDPPILILDEPTTGMDPFQQIKIRLLIQNLSHHHTIIFSTHILSEVEVLCKKVVILHQGKLVAKGDQEILKSQLTREAPIILETNASKENLLEILKKIQLQKILIHEKKQNFTIYHIYPKKSDSQNNIEDQIYEIIKKQPWKLRTFLRKKTSLEDLFVHLTQKNI